MGIEKWGKLWLLTIIFVACLSYLTSVAFVQNRRANQGKNTAFSGDSQLYPPIWQVLLAEAVSEGYEGMYAVACVIRNRGGDLNGFAGAKRKDLEEFCQRQGARYISLAKTIERAIFENNACDTTGGATHFENIETFGSPYWIVGMHKTCKIGRHTFYKWR